MGCLYAVLLQNAALVRRSAIAQIGVVRCVTREWPNAYQIATSIACVRLKTRWYCIWYCTVRLAVA